MNKIVYILVLLLSGRLFSQEKDKNLYNGNQSFAQKSQTNAEADYRVTESKKSPKKAVAGYNLGNSIYRQNQHGEAQIKYIQALETAKTKVEKHRIYHNLGNTFMLDKNYEAAAEAYKNALRNNPFDEETRYNYALAKKKKKENPPPKNDKKDNKGKGGQDKKPQPENNKNDKENKNDTNKEGDKDKNKGDGDKKEDEKDEMKEAIDTIEALRNELNEVNLLNAKLLYVNKIFKAKNLTESQKLKVIASFDKATTPKQAKELFESIQNSEIGAKKEIVKESLGFASKAAGIAPKKVIVESNDVISRMQKLANIK